ncbi:MAG TPA: DUF4286 family protein [Pyrinomonadaceae bacterium]
MIGVTYEITAAVSEDLVIAFETFMIGRHIPDLMATGCFSGATFSRSQSGRYRIRYEAHDRESLDKYMLEHAARLREDVLNTFPDGLDISREEWDVLASF